MNVPLFAATPATDAAADSGPKLERTHSHAMAAMAFTLAWHSEQARHTDCLVVRKMNLWRDILPAEIEAHLMDKPVGHAASHRFAAGELAPNYREDMCLDVATKAFKRHYRKCYIEPRSGRFYPKGIIAGVKGIYPEDVTPFRVAETRDEGLKVDLNPPLAGRELRLETRILDIWAGREEHGGACSDIGELVSLNGPGMQARWRGRPTDFWSDLPFVRIDPGPDANFYTNPRLVQHLDTTALEQVEGLYRRLVAPGGRVLDLMSSWDSHLPADLAPAHVTGLGMNSQELEANPTLNERVTHDLNLDPRLPFDAETFDAVVCTVSVEYLTKPVEVFAQVRRVLRPGGRFIVTFSNRWFPPKVIKAWQDVHEFERMGLVLEYFHQAGGYDGLETWSLRGLPRPENDKYADRMPESDPVYAVWGEKAA
jgi:SAM-dependent methyltransferase